MKRKKRCGVPLTIRFHTPIFDGGPRFDCYQDFECWGHEGHRGPHMIQRTFSSRGTSKVTTITWK